MAFGKKKKPLVNSFDLLYQIVLKDEEDVSKQMADLADILMEHRGVLAVFHEMKDADVAQNIVSFLSGVVYALNGKIYTVGRETYLFAGEEALNDGSLEQYIKEVGEN